MHRQPTSDSAAGAATGAGGVSILLFERNPLPAWIVDLDTWAFMAVNEAALRCYGYTREEFLAMNLNDLHSVMESPSGADLFAGKAGDSGHPAAFSHHRKNGAAIEVEVFWHELSFDGRQAMLMLANEVTDRKRAEAALRQSLEELADFVDHATVGLHWVGPDGRILWVNQAELELLGYSRPEYIGRSIAEFHVDSTVARDILHRLDNRETLHNYEARLRAKDGSIKYVLINSNVRWRDGEFVHTRCFTRDITHRKLAEQALAESEQRFRAIFNQVTVGIAQTDLSGRFVLVNKRYCDIVGRSAEELRGLRLQDIIHPDDRPRDRALFERLVTAGEDFVIEKRYVRPDGAPVWVMNSVSLVSIAGCPLHVVAVVSDVSDRKRADAERAELLAREQAARRQAEAANRAKDEFFAILSHELRTPLNTILGWTQTLLNGNAPEETRLRALAAIEQSAKTQAQLIDDLIDAADSTAGRLRLQVQAMQLIPAIDAAIESLRPALAAKAIQLDTALDAAADAVIGDPARLQQVVWNLLSNAVKFTPPCGSIRLTLSRRDDAVELEVVDDGEGIGPDFLPYLFDRFRQGDASSRKRHHGLGLGLAIVRSLVELHGGTVTASSPGKGQGATFTVRLPVRRAEPGAVCPAERRPAMAAPAAAPAARPAGVTRPRLDGLRILCVDDDDNTREMLQQALQLFGAETAAAGSAGEAFELLQSFRPQVLISDIGMPGEDGCDLMRKVRNLPSERGRATPAVALTGYAREQDQRAARAAGFQAFAPKPVDLDKLLLTIVELAQRV